MLLALWFVAFARSSSYYPELPVQYISNFILFDTESTIVPPYTDYLPPGSVSFGTTFYDWTLRSMVEVYRDKCVDIFPGGNDFGCHFINIQNRTLLTRQFANGTEDCCVYQPRWFPPPPDFLSRLAARANGTALRGVYPFAVDWWTIDVPPSNGGPFSYGFATNAAKPKVGLPAAFSFASIEGFVLQSFVDVRHVVPPSTTWRVPSFCKAAKQCTYTLSRDHRF